MRTVPPAAAALLVLAVPLLARLFAQDGQPATADLLKSAPVKAALDAARAGEPRTLDDQVRFCAVAAPPFKEAARGELLRQAFQQLGLRNVRVDKAGNVIGDRPGAAARPRGWLSAHLDTVFPEDTDVRVTREGQTLRGPGIGDDCRGLAVMVSAIRALRQANVRTGGTLTFVATVGEEGLGDLRGVKQLFKETPAGEVDRFVSIDGSGLGAMSVGVGSLRYRVTFKGPGGHSFAAFGLASPVNALGRAIAKIADFQVSADPKTTFNVGRVGGGTSVNAIPSDAWMEVDMRSSAPAALAALDARFQRAIDAAVAEENERWRAPRTVTAVKERVGDRPAASTPSDSPIVRAVEAVHRSLGLPLSFSEGSTDSNIPMSLHIPAITIGGGGRGAGVHTTSESFDSTESWRGTQRALLLTITLAQR
jgi:tripeptide aminopeptidase